MALLDKAYKQRMVGALVLIAIAVIFLPMLFSRQDEARHVQVDAPAAPQAPAASQIKVEPVNVPEQQPLPQEPVPTDEELSQPSQAPATQQPPSMPIAPAPSRPTVSAPPAKVASAPAQAPAQTPAPRMRVTDRVSRSSSSRSSTALPRGNRRVSTPGS